MHVPAVRDSPNRAQTHSSSRLPLFAGILRFRASVLCSLFAGILRFRAELSAGPLTGIPFFCPYSQEYSDSVRNYPLGI